MHLHYSLKILLLHVVLQKASLSILSDTNKASLPVFGHKDCKNFTLSTPAAVILSRFPRSVAARDEFYDVPPTARDEFYDATPTILPEVCSTSPQELQALNSVLLEALNQMMTASSSSNASTSTSCDTQSQQPATSNCSILILYIKATSSQIVCERAGLKKINIVSDSSYATKEAEYKGRIGKLKTVILKLRQNQNQTLLALQSGYETRLQLLQNSLDALLKEVVELRGTVNSKMIDIVAERIELSKFAEAIQEYKKIQMSRDASLPQILEKVYKGEDIVKKTGKIGVFIVNLPYIEEEVVAAAAFKHLLQKNSDLDSLSVLVLDNVLSQIAAGQNFKQIYLDLQALTHSMISDLKTSLESVLSSAAYSMRHRNTSDLVLFACDQSTQSYFLSYCDKIMKILYDKDGVDSLDHIIPLLKALPNSPTVACARATTKLMGNGIFSKKGLEFVHVLSQRSAVIGDSSLQPEVPSSLRIFEGKWCTLRNYHKGNEFLTTSPHKKDSDRRHVTTFFVRLDKDGYWYIPSKDEGKSFQIQTSNTKEYLYAADDHLKYDKDRRSVFTWVPGNSVKSGFWELIPYSNGLFRIRNTFFGEHLYAAVHYYKNARKVFTWGLNQHLHYVDQYWWIKCVAAYEGVIGY